jgi:hypothetical protein
MHRHLTRACLTSSLQCCFGGGAKADAPAAAASFDFNGEKLAVPEDAAALFKGFTIGSLKLSHNMARRSALRAMAPQPRLADWDCAAASPRRAIGPCDCALGEQTSCCATGGERARGCAVCCTDASTVTLTRLPPPLAPLPLALRAGVRAADAVARAGRNPGRERGDVLQPGARVAAQQLWRSRRPVG